MDYDNEPHFGNLITEPDFDLVRQRQDNAYFDLLHVFVDKQHAYWDTSLYRGYLTVRHGDAEFTVAASASPGEPLTSGVRPTCSIPISPLQVEADEREGVDAAQLSLRLPKDIRWSVVYAPQDGIDRSTEATRIATTIHNFDVAALGGRFARTGWPGAILPGNGAAQDCAENDLHWPRKFFAVQRSATDVRLRLRYQQQVVCAGGVFL